MKPRSVEFLLGSRYTLPLWLIAGIWLYLKVASVWDKFPPEQQVALAFASCGYALMIFISAIKVLPYERAMHRQGDAGRTPEQIAEQRRRRKPFLLLLAFGGGIAGLWWLPEHPIANNEVNSYALLTCFLLAAIPVMFVVAKLLSRLPSMIRRIRASVPKKPERTFIVQWCQPVPKHSAVAAEIRGQLPDYCKTLLSSAQPGDKKEAATQARNPLSAVADVAATHS